MAGEIDGARMKEYVKRVFGTMSGAVTAAMIHLGDRLGLYASLRDAGPATSEELAARTGLSERWVREWLFQQGAAEILDSDAEGRFSLSPEGVAVLADEDHPAFGGGLFSQLPATFSVLEKLPSAFESGLGLPYDVFGPEGARGIERGFAPWYRSFLVPVAIARLEGVEQRLLAGGLVADVGCGGGVALIELAKAFPRSDFHGYDISQHALARAQDNRDEAGVANVHFHDARAEPMGEEPRFDLVLSFDCLHDMTHPEAAMAAIRKAIAADGVWLIADIKAKGSYERNVAENPMAPLMYGLSVLSCMSSALSEPGGAGLGTLGLHEDLVREMTLRAGFSRCEVLDFGHPVNAFYEVRP